MRPTVPAARAGVALALLLALAGGAAADPIDLPDPLPDPEVPTPPPVPKLIHRDPVQDTANYTSLAYVNAKDHVQVIQQHTLWMTSGIYRPVLGTPRCFFPPVDPVDDLVCVVDGFDSALSSTATHLEIILLQPQDLVEDQIVLLDGFLWDVQRWFV